MASRKTPVRARHGAFPAMEWLEEAAGALPRLMLAGGRRAMVENHTGILEFSPSCVRLLTRQGVLLIRGTHLLLTQIRPDALTVRGEIQSIELPSAEPPEESVNPAGTGHPSGSGHASGSAHTPGTGHLSRSGHPEGPELPADRGGAW
jgi:sporulation protein YqfC